MRQEDTESIFYVSPLISFTSYLSNQADPKEKWLNATSIEQALAILLLKLSILALYRRIFPSPRWSLLNILTGLMYTLLVGFYSSTALVKILGCIPREKIFHPEMSGNCVNIDVLLNICDAFDVVTDFLTLVLPVKTVRELDLGWMKKAGVWVVLALGLWYIFLFCSQGREAYVLIEVVRRYSAWSGLLNDFEAMGGLLEVGYGVSQGSFFGGEYLHSTTKSY